MNKKIYVFSFLVVVIFLIGFLAYQYSQKQEISSKLPATVSTLSISGVTSPASAVLAGTKNIHWKTDNYPSRAGVNINLIRKISDSPKEFSFVRSIKTDTPNDGEDFWVPQNGENADDLYIEVTCSNTYEFKAGCSLSTDPIKAN
jgi:hypothetical protein